jgi:NADH/NAD ratio-sensing transcriptional regulator Rex
MVKMVPLETQGRTEPRDKMVNLANLVLKVTQELVERRASLEMPDKMESQESQVKKDATGFQEFLGRRVSYYFNFMRRVDTQSCIAGDKNLGFMQFVLGHVILASIQ